MYAPAHVSTATALTTLYAVVVRPLCVAAITAALGLPAVQAGEFYLKIDGIDGESVDPNHKEWIDIDSVLQGGESPTAAGRRAATLGEVSIAKWVDKATPKLNEAVAKGKVIDKVEISGTATYASGDSTREPYFQWELKNVQISSYRTDPDSRTDPGGRTYPPGAEALTLGGFTAGNLVEYQYDGSGQPSGRVVESFRVEPGTGLARFDYVDPAVRLKGGLRLQPVGTPNVVDHDDDRDGVADRVTLSALGTTGVDGYEIATVAREMSHNFEMRHGDPNNDARITVTALYDKMGKDGTSKGKVPASWDVEKGTSAIANGKRELKVDFTDLGVSQYEYTIQNGSEIVAQGVASVVDALVLEGAACDEGGASCSSLTQESVALNYDKVRWTYSKLDRGVLPDGEEIELDPAVATSVSLRPVGGDPLVGQLTSSRLTFANFESVDVLSVSAVPEPGALVLTAIAAAVAASGHRTAAV